MDHVSQQPWIGVRAMKMVCPLTAQVCCVAVIVFVTMLERYAEFSSELTNGPKLDLHFLLGMIDCNAIKLLFV
jgi:hypothetical protein